MDAKAPHRDFAYVKVNNPFGQRIRNSDWC